MSDSVTNHRAASQPFQPKAAIVGLAFIAITMIAVTAVSPHAMLVVLRAGAPAAAVCICAAGLGLWIVRAIGLQTAPLRWQLLLSCVFGLGVLSLLVLLLGMCGVLQRGVWVGILLASLIAGIARFRTVRTQARAMCEVTDETAGWMRLLWLILVPFAVLAILGATLPPGILWPAEGNGYDVLEYHLGVPREYFDDGEISYLPHNIYSNFPFSVEMLYLLSMILHGDALTGVFTAKLINVALAFLAVGGVWLAGREFGPRAGIVAGVSAASVPILTYLSVIAYVENGMLAFAAAAVAATIRAFRVSNGPRWQWCLVAGLCAGFACGCKYTAVAMVLLPLLCSMLWLAIRSGRRGFRYPLAFGIAALAAFGPWLVKNVVYTGNPVFPLARSVFHEREGIWNDERAAHWHDGHLPAPEDRPLVRRLGRLWQEVLGAGSFTPETEGRRGVPDNQSLLGSALYGPLPLLAIVGGIGLGVLRSRRRTAQRDARGIGVAWTALAVVLIAWTCFTHLAGRFAILLVVPAAVIAGCTLAEAMRNRRWRTAGVLILLGITAWDYSTIHRIFTPAKTPYLSADLFGRVDFMLGENSPHLAALNERLRAGERILVIGDARRLYLLPGADYCVVFNRSRFAEAAETLSSDDLIVWLREQGYAHVYVDWVEMFRLRGSRYGFWPSVTVELFQSLVNHGLEVEQHFHTLGLSKPYGTLLRVPAAP